MAHATVQKILVGWRMIEHSNILLILMFSRIRVFILHYILELIFITFSIQTPNALFLIYLTLNLSLSILLWWMYISYSPDHKLNDNYLNTLIYSTSISNSLRYQRYDVRNLEIYSVLIWIYIWTKLTLVFDSFILCFFLFTKLCCKILKISIIYQNNFTFTN